MPDKTRPKCAYCHREIKKGELLQFQRLTLHTRCWRSYASTHGRKVCIALVTLLLVCPLSARPNPQMSCKGTHRGVRCEAKYVWPVIPEWRTTSGNVVTLYGEGYGEGFGMNFTVGEEWTLIEMEIGGQILRAEARVVDGRAQFRPVQSQIASKPP